MVSLAPLPKCGLGHWLWTSITMSTNRRRVGHPLMAPLMQPSHIPHLQALWPLPPPSCRVISAQTNWQDHSILPHCWLPPTAPRVPLTVVTWIWQVDFVMTSANVAARKAFVHIVGMLIIKLAGAPKSLLSSMLLVE